MSIDRDSITTADRLTLTIDTTIQPGAAFTPPTLSGTLGEWTISDRYDPGPRRNPDGSLHHQLQLVLEPFLAGDYEIPPLTFAWQSGAGLQPLPPSSSAGAAAPATGTLTTQPLPITVTSVLDEEPKDLAVSPARGPLSLPARATSLWWVVAGAGLAFFTIAGGVLAYRRFRPRTQPPPDWQIAALALSRAAANPAQPLPWPVSLDQASLVLAGFLRHQLQLGPGAVTSADLENKEPLRLRLGHRTYERALDLLRRLEALRFGGGDLDPPARLELVKSVLSVTGAAHHAEGAP